MSLIKYDHYVNQDGLIEYADDDAEMRSFVFVKSQNKFYHPLTGTYMGITAFDLEFAGRVPRRSGRPSQYAKSDLTIQSVEDVIYYPKEEPGSVFVLDGIKYVNSVSPMSIPDIDPDWIGKDDWHTCLNHVRTIFSEEDAGVVLKWMAHNVQKPGHKILWAPIIVGTQGDGKTTLLKMLSAAMGRRNVKHVSPEALDSAFNGYASGAAVVALEEVRVIGKSRHPIMEKLKPLLTNDVVEVVSKGMDGRQVPNTTNYIALTNHEDALVLDENDRRWGVFRTKFKDRSELTATLNEEYWDKLHSAIENGAGQIRSWLLAMDLDGFNPHNAPAVTEAKMGMIRASRSSAAENIEMVMGCSYGVTEGVILTSSLAKALKEYGYRVPEGRGMTKAMSDLGFETTGKAAKFRGVLTRWYYKRGLLEPVQSDDTEALTKAARDYVEKNDPEIEGLEKGGQDEFDESIF